MAFKIHEQNHDAAAGLATFHILESHGGRNSLVYVVVPVKKARRPSPLLLRRSARQAAKQVLLDAAAVL